MYDCLTSVESRTTVVQEMQDGYLPVDERVSTEGEQNPVREQEFDGEQVDAAPEQIRQTIQAYVKTDDYDVNREALRLWQGSDEGRLSASEANIAFVAQLTTGAKVTDS